MTHGAYSILLRPQDELTPILVELCDYADTGVALRFLAKVAFSDDTECWLWTGCKQNSQRRHKGWQKMNPDWRPRFHVGPGRRQSAYAHRVAWRLWRGPLSASDVVMHNCPDGDNSLCVNPWHLLLGTQGENMWDRIEKRR